MKTAFVITLAVIAQAVANTLLSKGMKVIASMPSFGDGFSLMMLAYALEKPFHLGRNRSADSFFSPAFFQLSRGPT